MPDGITLPEDSLARMEQKIDELTQNVESMQQVYASLGELYRDMAPIGASMLEVASDQVAQLEDQGVFSLLSKLGAVATQRDATQKPPPSIFALMRASAKDEDVRRGLSVAIDVLRTLGENRHGVASADPRKAKAQALAAMLAPKAHLTSTRPAGSAPRRVVIEQGLAAHASTSGAMEATRGTSADREQAAGNAVVDDDGFLVDAGAWDAALAEDMATSACIALTERHWTVLNFMRREFAETGRSPNIRRITTGSGVDTRELFSLFPQAPAKTAARIAGVPKPVGCV